MSPSPVTSPRWQRFGGVALAAVALVSLFGARANAQGPVIIDIPNVQEIYDCSVDGLVAIGGDARQDVAPPPPGLPALPPGPRDKFDPELFSFGVYPDAGYWNVPIESLRYITFDNEASTQTQIAFPIDELIGHTVTSLILPRSSSARLLIINTTRIEDGVEKRDAWVWFVDLTENPDPLVTSVVALGSDLDARCCSDDGNRIYCDDNAYTNVFWNCQRQQSPSGPGFQYNIFAVTVPIDARGVPANEDIHNSDPLAAPWWEEESVDCCSADGLLVYGREHNLKWYRATNGEPGIYRGTYTWLYRADIDGTGVNPNFTRGLPGNNGPTRDRVLVCTDDGQRAITAVQSRIIYSAWDSQLNRQTGIGPGNTDLYPIEIRNNQRSFGHYILSTTNQNVLPFVLDIPTRTYTTLRLLVGDVRGFEVEADETVQRVLGYSITVDQGTQAEVKRTLVQWVPSLSQVERLDFVYGIDPTTAPDPTNDVFRLFCASRTLEDLFCTYIEGPNPERVVRITKPVDPPPSIAQARIITNGPGTAERLSVTWSEDVFTQGIDPTLEASGGPVALTLASSTSRTFVYDLDRRINYDEVVTLDLAADAVQDFSLNFNAEVIDQPVVNKSDFNRPPPDTTGPVVTGAAIDADGETLTLIFDETVKFVKVPTLTGFDKPLPKAKAKGRKVRANTITFPLSRVIFEGESGNFRLEPGSVTDRKGNPNGNQSGPILNDSTIVDPDDPGEPEPPKNRPKTKRRPLGATANSYAQTAYNYSASFYAEPHYTENAYYAYLSAYQALAYGYEAGTVVRYDGPKLPPYKKAIKAYKDTRYQQVINSYNSMQFAYADYSATGSNTMLNTYLNSYYAYYYGNADLEAK